MQKEQREKGIYLKAMNKGHIPIRSCISCGKKRDKNDLIRLVLDQRGQVVRDDQGDMEGRGAYVCKERACQERLFNKKNRYINRAFRSERTVYIGSDLFPDPMA